MLKKKLILAGIVLFMFGLTTSSFAQMKCAGHPSSGHKHKPTDATTQVLPIKSIDVGNKICPVLNEKIDEKSKATYEYGGKIYNFCCASCIDEFKKDPGKYIKKIEEEMQKEKVEEKAEGPSEVQGHRKHSHTHH